MCGLPIHPSEAARDLLCALLQNHVLLAFLIAGMIGLPEPVRNRGPFLCVVFTLTAQMFCGFRCRQIRALCTGSLHHCLKLLRIFQEGTGLQKIFVEGLILLIKLEQGLLQTLQKALFVDIRTGIMDETQGSTSPFGLMWQ